jgi:hypothetical protein
VELGIDAGNKIDGLRELILMHVVGCKERESLRWLDTAETDFWILVVVVFFWAVSKCDGGGTGDAGIVLLWCD